MPVRNARLPSDSGSKQICPANLGFSPSLRSIRATHHGFALLRCNGRARLRLLDSAKRLKSGGTTVRPAKLLTANAASLCAAGAGPVFLIAILPGSTYHKPPEKSIVISRHHYVNHFVIFLTQCTVYTPNIPGMLPNVGVILFT